MPTILCVDNDAALLEIQKALLETKGYTVLTASEGLTGAALIRKQSIDAVVLDFDMPGMDGAQVAEILMQERPTPPIVICSGRLDEIPAWLMWFADALHRKGDGPTVLLSTVEKLFSAKKALARRAVGVAEQLSA